MTNLDDALRAMLRERATDIETVPAAGLLATAEAERGDVAELLDLPRPQARRARRPILLAAAAIVVLIAGLLVALGARDDHRPDTPPAHSSSTPAPVVTSVQTCRTSVPAAWKPALAAATVTVPQVLALRVEGVTSGGDAVVGYDLASDAKSGAWRIGYVPPGGSAVRPLYTVSMTKPTLSVQVSVQGDTVLLVIAAGDGDVHPQELDLIDVPSGTRQVIARTGKAGVGTIAEAFLQDGHVYWQESRADGTSGAIRDYDIARKTTRVATVDPVLAMSQSAAGVQWVDRNGKTVTEGNRLPTAVAARVGIANFDSFVTDGSTWAWTRGAALEWWSPSAGRVVRVTGSFATGAHISAVAGPLIYLANASGVSNGAVIDVRTGAVVAVGTGAITGHNGSFVGTPALAGVEDPSNRLMRVANTDLPSISC